MPEDERPSDTPGPLDAGTTATGQTQERRERRRAVLRLWRAETAYTAALAAFAVLAVYAYYNAYFGWDERAARAVQSFAPTLDSFMLFVSYFGSGATPWVLTIGVALFFLAFRRRSEMAALLLSAGGSQLVNRLFKMLIARPRPSRDIVQVYYESLNTESFPSGHVTFYVGFFGFLFFVAYALLARGTWLRPLVLTVTALPVLLVGFSRVYLGAHWPSDTLGAYLLSGLWLALCLRLYRRWKAGATFHTDGAETVGN